MFKSDVSHPEITHGIKVPRDDSLRPLKKLNLTLYEGFKSNIVIPSHPEYLLDGWNDNI